MFDCQTLLGTIREGKRLVVFLHDNPDPDCIAAGWLLARIAESVGVRPLLLYGGRLGRAENRTMVKQLKIPLRNLDSHHCHPRRTDRFALVDTQPGTGNNSFPMGLACHIVIDHHPARKETRGRFVDVRQDEGCTTTLLLEYYRACGLELDPRLATAIAYAIASETQDLEREATRADREAFQRVYPLVNLKTLGQIRHPVRSREYYRTIAQAMNQVQLSKNTCVCHIGKLKEAEVVAEVADFLVAMERITWCMVTGLHTSGMVISLRTTHVRARAHEVIHKVLDAGGKGGGHGMIAGGLQPCVDLATYLQLTERMNERLLKHLSRKMPERLRPLLEENAQDRLLAVVP